MNEALRAEVIFLYLKKLRAYCKAFPDYNISVNLNGMNGNVDVKVFHDNVCVESYLDPEDFLVEMLELALHYLEARCGPLPDAVKPEQPNRASRDYNVSWNDYGTCARCHAHMGEACRSLEDPTVATVRPHIGRQRFKGKGVRQGMRMGFGPI